MPNVKKLFVKIFTSKKGYKTFALCLDLGYTTKFLNFDIHTCAEALGLPVSALYDKEEGEYTV